MTAAASATATQRARSDSEFSSEEAVVDAYLRAIDPRVAPANATPHRKLEADFIDVAAAFGRRRRIAIDTWRAVGVPDNVLLRAGILR